MGRQLVHCSGLVHVCVGSAYWLVARAFRSVRVRMRELYHVVVSPVFEFQSRRPATYVYEGRAGDEERDVQHVKSLGIA